MLLRNLIFLGMFLVGVPLISFLINGILLFHCSNSYLLLPDFLNAISVLIANAFVALVYSLFIGCCILLYVFWVRRRGKGVTKSKIFLETIAFFIVVFFLLFIYLGLFMSPRSVFHGQISATKAILNSARPEAEMYFVENASYDNLCDSSTGVGVIVNNASSFKLSDRQGLLCSEWIPDVRCNTEKDRYAIYAKLPKQRSRSPMEYFCVDSSGFSGSVDKPVEGTSCR